MNMPNIACSFPDAFLKQMKSLLGEADFSLYLEAMNMPAKKGLRMNPLKRPSVLGGHGEAERLWLAAGLADRTGTDLKRSEAADRLRPIPWASGYTFEDPLRPGQSPLHEAGVYYIQEPSAMSAATLLGALPGERVLDLCAAPGSKTTQILECLKDEGMLAANEIVPKRSMILLENVIRHGADNCLVLNDSSKNIAKTFPESFDAVLVDAPCSGEGMFRKDPSAAEEWTPGAPAGCALRQEEILESAYRCLKPGGRMVYSTCTFSMEENEEQILSFLKKHADMQMAEPHVTFGRPGYAAGMQTEYSRRIYPMDGGEGHFAALLVKERNGGNEIKTLSSDPLPKEAEAFLREIGASGFPYYNVRNGSVYGSTHPFVRVSGCHAVRSFTRIGEIIRGRFEPDHAFFMSSSQNMRSYELTAEEAHRYMHGEQLPIQTEKGWLRVTFCGLPLGGARSDGQALKNKYPKFLRTR